MQSLEQAGVAQAEFQEQVQGYVRFSDIARRLNISRQLCDLVFKRAVKKQLITEERLKRWKASYKSRTTRAEFALLRTHEAWLKAEADTLGISWHDVLNRALNEHIHNQNSCPPPTPPAS